MREYNRLGEAAGDSEIDADSVVEVANWARQYGKNEQPSDAVIRFAIGMYQIRQLIDWTKGHGKPTRSIQQSAGAFVLHHLAAIEMAGGFVERYLPTHFSRIEVRETDWEALMYDMAIVCQQLVYIRQVGGEYAKGNVRAKRIDLAQLSLNGAAAIVEILASIPAVIRAEGIEAEADVLLKRDWKFTTESNRRRI